MAIYVLVEVVELFYPHISCIRLSIAKENNCPRVNI